MSEYKTIEGDVIDAICAEHYGTEHGTTEAVLAANPGLAERTGRLPAGVVIYLPEITVSPDVAMLQLWD